MNRRLMGFWGVFFLAIGLVSPAQAQPTPDFVWNNFSVTAGTLWTNAAAWLPAVAPTGSVDRVIGFVPTNLGGSAAAGFNGYRSTFAGAFDLNSLVHSGVGAPHHSGALSDTTQASLTGFAAADTLRFNTSSGGV